MNHRIIDVFLPSRVHVHADRERVEREEVDRIHLRESRGEDDGGGWETEVKTEVDVKI